MVGKIRFYPESFNRLSADEQREHKEKLLRRSVQYMYDHSPEYYQLRFKECGAEPGDIQTIEVLRNMAIFMDKERERQSMDSSLQIYGHPFGLHICCDPADVVSTGGTSGTTGHPTYPYTQAWEDREYTASAIDHMHKLLGLGRGDRAFFLYPLGVYATSAVLPGLEKSGILPLPIDIRLGPQPALEMVKWTRPTFWYTGVAIVEFYIDILKNKMGIDPRSLGFKCLMLGGEAGCGIP
jgi:phenylacetate-CoA ligase